MKPRLLALAIGMSALVAVGKADAAIITSYTFDGPSAIPGYVDAGATAGAFKDGSGFLTFDTTTGLAAPSVFKPYSLISDGPSDDGWVGFSVAPTSGNLLSLSTFRFDAQKDVFGDAAAANISLQLAYSTDGTNFTNVGAPSEMTSNSGGWDEFSIALGSVSELQDLASDVWFRLYLADEGAESFGLGLRLDNVRLLGDVTVNPVPEPTSMVLFGLGLLGPATMLRRSRRTV